MKHDAPPKLKWEKLKQICFSIFSVGVVLTVSIGCQMAKVLPGDARAPASKACTVCLENVSDQEIADHKAYSCDQHHCIDRECLVHQVKTLTNLRELEIKGLACCGESCQERISLTTVRELLPADDRVALDIRLAKAATPGTDRSNDHSPQTDTQRLAQGIEESFNLCCPKEGCAAVLDQVEGCNAATCSNEECKATFCYLCLEPQLDNRAAHAHVKEHSGNYWEMRPGYTQRYHWLIARKKLAHLFEKKYKWYQRILPHRMRGSQAKVDSTVRAAALESRKELLQENQMWPMPAGLTSAQWIQEVKDAGFSKEKTIEILQNEYIYRRQEKEKKSAAVIRAELQRLEAPVLASLDVRDAPANPPALPERIIPVMEDDPRVSRAFAQLGNMYQVGDLIWSGAVLRNMAQLGAVQFCLSLGGGSRLPTRDHYDRLRRAMGYPNNYNANLIPDMRGNTFWSSSVGAEEEGYAFYGNYGNLIEMENPETMRGSVRCLIRF